jgi:hypothetical protein
VLNAVYSLVDRDQCGGNSSFEELLDISRTLMSSIA